MTRPLREHERRDVLAGPHGAVLSRASDSRMHESKEHSDARDGS